MKTPVLILFIILNLLAVNIAAATNMHVEESNESHLAHTQVDTELACDIDDVACADHSCHTSVHMIGVIQYMASLSFSDTSTGFIIFDDSLQYLSLDSPFEPPKA